MASATTSRSGFTLIEVMIALGLFAVGVGIVATAFPTAIHENKLSADNTLGTLIAENALTICHSVLRHSDLVGIGTQLTDISGRIDAANRAYPIARADSRFGWLVAARQVTAGANDYQLAIVVFRRHGTGDQPAFAAGAISGNTLTGGDLGAPAIRIDTGEFRYVVRTDGTLGQPGIADGPVLTVPNPNGDESAAIICWIARTSFRQ